MIRTIDSLKKRLDSMIKNVGKENIIIEDGALNLSFHHYEFFPNEKIRIYCKEKLYAEVTNDTLRKPKGENDYYQQFHYCNWQKKYPSILILNEYTFKEWMVKSGCNL